MSQETQATVEAKLKAAAAKAAGAATGQSSVTSPLTGELVSTQDTPTLEPGEDTPALPPGGGNGAPTPDDPASGGSSPVSVVDESTGETVASGSTSSGSASAARGIFDRASDQGVSDSQIDVVIDNLSGSGSETFKSEESAEFGTDGGDAGEDELDIPERPGMGGWGL